MARTSIRTKWKAFLLVVLFTMGCVGGGTAIRSYSASGRVRDHTGVGVPDVVITFDSDSGQVVTTNGDGDWQAVLSETVVAVPSKEGFVFYPESKDINGTSSGLDFLATSAINPGELVETQASFNPGEEAAGLALSIDWNGASEIAWVKQGSDSLESGVDYLVIEDNLLISGDYLTRQTSKEFTLAVIFDAGISYLTIGVEDQAGDSNQPWLSHVENIEDVTVSYGTIKEGVLKELASTTLVTDSDGGTHLVSLDWDIRNYAPTTPGAYTAIGMVEVPPGIRYHSVEELMISAVVTVLPPTEYSISGRVTTTDGGLAGVTVEFSGGFASVVTDSNGEWNKGGLTGVVSINPSKEDYLFQPAWLEASETGEFDFVGVYQKDTDLSGKVVFHDTDLGLISAVEVGDQLLQTGDGKFTLALPPRHYEYRVDTLLGSYTGGLEHSGAMEHQLVVPPFAGWSRSYFNQLLIWSGQPETTFRWEYGRTVKVWIQPAGDGVLERHVSLAWDALMEWQNLLRGAVNYQRVYEEPEADILWYWAYPSEINHAAGLASVSYSRPSYLLRSATIWISRANLDSRGVYLHEIGHTLGLSHSNDRQDIMYPVLYTNILSDQEINMTRLLYSIPSATPSLGDFGPASVPKTYQAEEDIVTIIIE